MADPIDPTEPLEIAPAEAAALLGEGPHETAPLLLDCRTPEEHRLARIDGSTFIPMHEMQRRLDEIDGYRDSPVIVYCHTGVRSLAVASILRRHGFGRARSLAGGIDRWSREVDPSVPRY